MLVKNGQPVECWRSEVQAGNRAQSPIIFGDCVYLPSDTNPIVEPQDELGHLTCRDLLTGKVLWTSSAPHARGRLPSPHRKIWNDGGAFMLAAGKLLLLDGSGHFTLSDISRQGCTVLGDADFGTVLSVPHSSGRYAAWQYLVPPLLLNGKLYLRNHEKIACYDLR